MRPLKSSLLCVSVLSLLLSCAQSKQLTEMHDTTAEMNKTTAELNAKTGEMGATTKEMRDTTAQMNKKTGEMSQKLDEMKAATEKMQQTTDAVRRTSEQMAMTTGELYDASKQGGGASIRREAFDRMLESSSLGKKVDQAAQYYMAFEFQLWSGLGQDDSARRLDLMNDGAMEFFKAVQEVMEFTKVQDGSLDIQPLAGQTYQGRNSADNHAATLNALAVAMHLLNRKQLAALKTHPEMKPVSIYTMIQESLLKQRELTAGTLKVEDLPAYQQEVLENRDIAVKLLQARYNVLLAVFLEKTRPKGGLNLQTYLAASKTSWLGRMVKIPWKLDMDRLNPVQVEKFRQYLDWAIDTREFLKSIGEKPILDLSMGSMMKSIELVGHKQPTALAVDAQVKLQDSINRINSGAAPDSASAAGASATGAGSGAGAAGGTKVGPAVAQTAPAVVAGEEQVAQTIAPEHGVAAPAVSDSQAPVSVDPYEVSTIGTGVDANIVTADATGGTVKARPTIFQRWKKSMNRTWDKIWPSSPGTAPVAPATVAPDAPAVVSPAPVAPPADVPADSRPENFVLTGP